jgi:hypothetical protein
MSSLLVAEIRKALLTTAILITDIFPSGLLLAAGLKAFKVSFRVIDKNENNRRQLVTPI